jgi:hypothetical protein
VRRRVHSVSICHGRPPGAAAAPRHQCPQRPGEAQGQCDLTVASELIAADGLLAAATATHHAMSSGSK